MFFWADRGEALVLMSSIIHAHTNTVGASRHPLPVVRGELPAHRIVHDLWPSASNLQLKIDEDEYMSGRSSMTASVAGVGVAELRKDVIHTFCKRSLVHATCQYTVGEA